MNRDIDECWLKYETENIVSEHTKSDFMKEKDQSKASIISLRSSLIFIFKDHVTGYGQPEKTDERKTIKWKVDDTEA